MAPLIPMRRSTLDPSIKGAYKMDQGCILSKVMKTIRHSKRSRDANYHVVSIAYHEHARTINTRRDYKYLEACV